MPLGQTEEKDAYYIQANMVWHSRQFNYFSFVLAIFTFITYMSLVEKHRIGSEPTLYSPSC
jgi:hypothetical protein